MLRATRQEEVCHDKIGLLYPSPFLIIIILPPPSTPRHGPRNALAQTRRGYQGGGRRELLLVDQILKEQQAIAAPRVERLSRASDWDQVRE